MVKREILFCTIIILAGALDWLTTLLGVVFFGATETNLLLAGLTRSSLLLFSAVKLSAITITGLIFYKAETKAKLTNQISPLAKKFLNSGYAICLLILSFAVLNNFSIIVNVG
jgi:Domain of unknown function (DUF5658)